MNSVFSEQCLHPAPAPGFTDEMYAGTWYEVMHFIEMFKPKIGNGQKPQLAQ